MRSFAKNINKGFAANFMCAGQNKATQKDDFYSRLAAEIVIAAVRDWRELVKARAWRKPESWARNFTELRCFFKSDYCEFLMQNFDIAPERILDMLEKELAAAMREDERKRWT